MKVLVACEESQCVALAFREYGHLAFSCDLKKCSGGYPSIHFQEDCFNVINRYSWDLIIAHPPCTYLAVSGALNLFDKFGNINSHRYELMKDAVEFFYKFVHLGESGQRLCIENPRPMARCHLPKHSQVIQPFEFGEDFSKQTLLWEYNLPLLIGDCYATSKRKFGKSWCAEVHSVEMRSKTFNGTI